MKRMRPTNIESIPDDLLFKIFVDHLSAEEIFETARLVCRKWYQMTNTDSFIHSHLRRTDYVLQFHKKTKRRLALDDTLSMSLRHGRVKISKLRFKFRGVLYLGGCNGLMVGYIPGTVYIVNPLTNRSFGVPRIHFTHTSRYCIAYAEASMVNKAVVTSPNSKQVVKSCRILTVGVDKSWRSVPSDHLTYTAKIAFDASPLVTEGGGFLHWCGESDNRVLSLNVETEVIKETPLPFPEVDGQRRAYLSTGKYLSLLVSCGEYLWEVWEMKPQTGKWRKVMNFSLEDVRSMFEPFGFGENEYIAPIGWLMYPQVLVFAFSDGNKPQVFPYNLVTKEIESIELPGPMESYTCFLHQSSLVRI